MKKLCLALVVVFLSLVWIHTAGGDNAFLKALQDSLHKLGDPWIAGETELSKLSIEEKRKLCGIIPLSLDKKKMKKSPDARMRRLRKEPLPSSLDWRNHNGKNWMTPVKDQGMCGACWAFAMCSAMEARIKIFNDIPDENPNLSEQFLISCNTYGYGCGLGTCLAFNDAKKAGTCLAFNDVKRDGIPDEACFPYVASEVPCSNRCDDWQERVVKVTDWDWFNVSNPIPVQEKVVEGPVYSVVMTKEDFFYYKSGVYEPIMGKEIGNHGVSVCGWNSSGKWLCKNCHGSLSAPYFYISDLIEIAWCIPEILNAPLVTVGQLVIQNDDNGNNRLDPGESGDIIITLENTGAGDASGTTATLSIESTNITVIDGSADYGNIPGRSSGANISDPFKVTCSASAPEGPVLAELSIQANSGAYSCERNLKIWIGDTKMHYADVEASNATLTVTDNSAIGFEKPDTNGSGFVYPAGGNNTLYYGSMAFGNSSSYLVDNWYISGDSDHDWRVTTSLDGRLVWILPPTKGDTMIVGYYDDSGISPAKNVTCRQEAWAFNSPNYDDFVILRFTYTNNGSSTLTNLYSAIFADFDVSSGGTSDDADINETKYLSWMSSESVYVGITLLDPLDKLANASSINNATYVHPNNGMSDNDQYGFMNHTHHSGSQSNADYGVVVSAGKFDITAGDSQVVAFAIVGGESETEIEEHSDAARNVYVHGGLENKDTKVTPGDITLSVTPSLMLNTGTITFSLPRASKVTIDIYDISGRLCQNFEHGLFKAGTHTLKWNIKDELLQRSLRPGVFFVRLFAESCGKSANKTLIKKIILLK